MASKDQIKEAKKVALILGAILLFGVGAILFRLVPQIADSRKQAEQGFALTNLKKVTGALLLYSEEHGLLPSAEAYQTGAFAPALSQADFLVHPNQPETLSFNVRLAGTAVDDLEPSAVMVFPGPADWPLAALPVTSVIGEEPCVSYVKGEVECVKASELLAGQQP